MRQIIITKEGGGGEGWKEGGREGGGGGERIEMQAYLGAGDIDQLAKYKSCKHEDLTLNHQTV